MSSACTCITLGHMCDLRCGCVHVCGACVAHTPAHACMQLCTTPAWHVVQTDIHAHTHKICVYQCAHRHLYGYRGRAGRDRSPLLSFPLPCTLRSGFCVLWTGGPPWAPSGLDSGCLTLLSLLWVCLFSPWGGSPCLHRWPGLSGCWAPPAAPSSERWCRVWWQRSLAV